MPEYSRKINEFLIKKVIDEYNLVLQKSDISLSLSNFYDYQTYSVMKDYRKFSAFVGEPELYQRDRSLSRINTNIIVIYSSVNGSSTDYNSYDLCKGRFYYSYGRSMSSDSIIVIINAIRSWIEASLQIKLDEIFDQGHSTKDLKIKSEILEELDQCLQEKPKKIARQLYQKKKKPNSEDSSVESMFSIPEIIPSDIDKSEMKTKYELKKTETLKIPKIGNGLSSQLSKSKKDNDTLSSNFDPLSTLNSSSSKGDMKNMGFDGKVKKFVFPDSKVNKDKEV